MACRCCWFHHADFREDSDWPDPDLWSWANDQGGPSPFHPHLESVWSHWHQHRQDQGKLIHLRLGEGCSPGTGSILEGRWLASSAVLRNQCHQTSFVPRLKLKRFFLNVFTMVNLHQVGNPEAVVCWCLLPHPKITANQAQVSRAGRRSLHLPGPYWFTCFIGWVADRSQPIFHFKGCEQRHGSAKACAWRSKNAWQTQEASQDSGWRSRSTTLAQQGRGSDCRVCLREVSFIPGKSFAFYRNS